MKTCNVCKAALPLMAFAISRAEADGRSYTCRVCAAERCRRWRLAHPGAYSKWHQTNRGRKRAYDEQWRKSNTDYRRDAYRQWAKANPDKVAANVRSRELAKLKATPPWATKESMLPFYTTAVRLTRETGIKHEVDHIVPIRSKIICGLHVPANLQVITRAANKTKGNHLVITQPASALSSSTEAFSSSSHALASASSLAGA